ncbi:hypothetical protein [Wenxinia saemankumensis]|uniref:hypothetical protein n=1 Tax=Wenxinia saemankumensis TaxID=1447782 RepID=UPI0011150FB2|nr:hypothetical protein [Wenxinia saemankumensis]
MQELEDQLLIAWNVYTDPVTGEVTPPTTDMIRMEDVSRFSRSGELEIISLPTPPASAASHQERIALSRPDSGATARALYRQSYNDAVEELVSQGVIPVRGVPPVSPDSLAGVER